uniref:Putative secreted protein n=1 Tax=Rhipicephalus microplus TaxID=6941 RepID=A0A6M2DBR4_RHIMP
MKKKKAPATAALSHHTRAISLFFFFFSLFALLSQRIRKANMLWAIDDLAGFSEPEIRSRGAASRFGSRRP